MKGFPIYRGVYIDFLVSRGGGGGDTIIVMFFERSKKPFEVTPPPGFLKNFISQGGGGVIRLFPFSPYAPLILYFTVFYFREYNCQQQLGHIMSFAGK